MPLSDLSNPSILLKESWDASLRRGADGTPLLPPAFVAEAGPRVWILDVREADELGGPLGHIPGVVRAPLRDIGSVAEKLPAFTPVILVCGDGVHSSTAARYLSALGMTTVAAMEGGLIAWRSDGFGTSRDPAAKERTLSPPAPGHGSDGRPLVADREKGDRRLRRDMIERHVGDPAKVRRVKLAAFLLASQTSCVDGREDRAIIGTPGGDAGELILGLAAVEAVTGNRVDLTHVPALTRAFADTFGGIYLHTDNHALNQLARSMAADPRLSTTASALNTVREWESFLRHPPHQLRDPLLDHLVMPNHVGCGHLRLALTKPERYSVRSDLITAFFRAFYRGLWDGAPDLHWVVLGGDHAEGAVVNVTLEGELSPFTEVPMVAPSVGGIQMFVNHPQVVGYLRAQIARFLAIRANELLPIDLEREDELFAKINELGGAQASATLQALAAGLPVFNVHFSRTGSIEVTDAGSI